MTVHWAFSQLGIDPTTERSEIRRAYARRLKAMDLDSDVEGYARLRDARDAALAYADGLYDPALDEELLADAAGAAEADADLSPEGAPVVIEDGGTFEDAAFEEPEANDEIALAQQRLIAILFPGGEEMYRLWPEEAEEVLRLFEVLKTDPRLDQIDMLASAGDWFAQVIAQSLPRSDPLVQPAADYFGWKRDQEVGVHPAVAAVVARANALDWRDRLEERSHRLHRAWKEMTRPANEHSKRGWVSAKRVSELLSQVRTRHPSLEGDMDWYRICMWETGSHSRLNWQTGALLIFFLIQAVRFFGDDPVPSGSPTPSGVEAVFSQPLTDPDADIGHVLAGLTDTATLRAKNPELYSLLRANWLGARDNGDRTQAFVSANRALLLERLERSWADASYTVLRHKMETDVRIARQLTPEDCANYLGGPIPQLNPTQAELRRKVEAERLLEIDPTKPLGAPSDGTYSYRIPVPVITEAMERSRLTRDQLEKGLDLNSLGAEPARACNARIGLREAILAQPAATGAKIMRDMED